MPHSPESGSGHFRTREALQEDGELLWEYLAIAGYEPDAATARRVPVVAAHL